MNIILELKNGTWERLKALAEVHGKPVEEFALDCVQNGILEFEQTLKREREDRWR